MVLKSRPLHLPICLTRTSVVVYVIEWEERYYNEMEIMEICMKPVGMNFVLWLYGCSNCYSLTLLLIIILTFAVVD